MSQQLLFDKQEFVKARPQSANIGSRSGCFVDNMKLPVHRWYRYSAGFSADWVRFLLRQRIKSSKNDCTVLDPFAGIATTLVACNVESVKSFGFEPHPFVFKMAEAKLDLCGCSTPVLANLFSGFINDFKKHPRVNDGTAAPLLGKCYTKESLYELLTMKKIMETDYDDPEARILWFVITSILRSCSCVGTAQWQYVLPNKTKACVSSPLKALIDKTAQILEDIDYLGSTAYSHQAKILRTDARNSLDLEEDSIDYVITSPPYPNNYDYADATRLEMTFWGEIRGWADLHSTVRSRLLCSCSQHSAAEKVQLPDVLREAILSPILPELRDVCERLEMVRLEKGGKKTYHTMIASYFLDLALVFRTLRRVCRPGAEVCFVIGDSAPYGVYVPVEKWLGELAVAGGFRTCHFEKIRDRNIKWKNRKHDVPLHEGRLWIQG